MPHVLKARDGRNHTVSDKEDVFRLVTEYLGSDFSDWLEDWAEDYKAEVQDEMDETREIAKEAEAELDQLKNHQRQVFTDVYEEAARLMNLTESETMNTSEIRILAEKIWDVVGNEL